MTYKIVADSSANLFSFSSVPYSYVPLKIITSAAEYVDDENLDVFKMVEEVRATKGRSSTSCPNVQDWMDAFGGADRVFAVAITSNLSGSCAAARQAAHEYEAANPGARVHVVDSLSAGPGLVLIVEKLAQLINENLEFDEIVDAINAYMPYTHLVFSLQSLTNLARNGRVSPAVAKIAGVLGIRVVSIASDVGTLEPVSKCRGETRAMDAIYRIMKEKGFSGGKVRIAHCFNEESAIEIERRILSDFPDCDISVGLCGALCSFYAEKGGLLLSYEGSSRSK